MDTTMLEFNTAEDTTSTSIDPVLERALFFAEYDLIELRATIPQAEAPEPKWVY